MNGMATRRPVGGIPPYGPVGGQYMVTRVATRSPSAIWSSTTDSMPVKAAKKGISSACRPRGPLTLYGYSENSSRPIRGLISPATFAAMAFATSAGSRVWPSTHISFT